MIDWQTPYHNILKSRINNTRKTYTSSAEEKFSIMSVVRGKQQFFPYRVDTVVGVRGEDKLRIIGYFTISNILERNLIRMSNLERILMPKSPDTTLWGGRLRQATSTFLISNSKNLISGIVITGTYSIPLAVIISTLLVGLEGSQPIAKAISTGMVVILAPVSKTILSILELRLPFKRTLRIITPVFISRGSLAISRLEGYSVALREFILGIVYQGKSFIRDRLPINLISVWAVGDEPTFGGYRGGFVKLRNPYQEPFVLKSFFDIFNSFYPHFIKSPYYLTGNDNTTSVLKNQGNLERNMKNYPSLT